LKISNDSSDEALLLAFKAGDRYAYELIYERYWQLLYRFSRKMLQDDTVAKDVVQEVFTAVWTKMPTLQTNPPLAAYLYTLTRNRIFDMAKRTKVEKKYLESLATFIQTGGVPPDRLFIEKELYDIIEAEIRNLPERMRLVFEMSRKQYKSNQEIAEALNLSNKTVKNQLSSALKILKGKLGDRFQIYLLFF